MSSNDSVGYVSIIGFNYLHPIILLLEALLAEEPMGSNQVQAAKNENGVSCSIIVLAVLLIESAIARLKYERNKITPRSGLLFVREEFPNYNGFEKLKELFVIRDAIVHNHIWEAKFRWDDIKGMELLAAEIWEGSGDKKLEDVIDKHTRKTMLLKLHLFPTRISRQDAFFVLKETVAFLSFIEEHGTKHINVSNQYVLFGEQLISFPDLIYQL